MEDCASCSLVRDELDSEISDEEWRLKHNEARDEKIDMDNCDKDSASVNDAERDYNITNVLIKRVNEYKKNKVKNVAMLQKKLAKLNKKYSLLEEFKAKKEPKKPVSKKKNKVQQREVIQ